MQYKYVNDQMGNLRLNVICAIKEDGSQMSIPADPQNRDWQQYQKWLAEGNEPLPAE